MTTPTITLTGIQPTGELHLGNYAGAIRPLAQLAAQPARETYVFVADLHALNSRPDPDQHRDRTRKMAAALLASGLDHDRVHVYRQSRVPAIAQISALLSNVTSKGTLNRAHAYKALVAANTAAGRDTDHGVNMGLFTYPVLMAAAARAARPAGQARPPRRHRQPPPAGPQGSGHARRAARHVRGPGSRPGGPRPLPNRRHRLRRRESPARRATAHEAGADARPLPGAAGRLCPARRSTPGGRAARQPARHRDPAPDVKRHGPVGTLRLREKRLPKREALLV